MIKTLVSGTTHSQKVRQNLNWQDARLKELNKQFKKESKSRRKRR